MPAQLFSDHECSPCQAAQIARDETIHTRLCLFMTFADVSMCIYVMQHHGW